MVATCIVLIMPGALTVNVVVLDPAGTTTEPICSMYEGAEMRTGTWPVVLASREIVTVAVWVCVLAPTIVPPTTKELTVVEQNEKALKRQTTNMNRSTRAVICMKDSHP
jgi:hypothetical protein